MTVRSHTNNPICNPIGARRFSTQFGLSFFFWYMMNVRYCRLLFGDHDLAGVDSLTCPHVIYMAVIE